MNIVICGAGEVGRHTAEELGTHGNNITIIDLDMSKLAIVEQAMDVRILHGNATHVDLLREAGVGEADLFLAATNIDEINLLSASLAHAVGAKTTIARVHHSAYFDREGFDYGLQLGIDHLVCPEYVTAGVIAQTLRAPGALAVERIARGQIEVRRLPVDANARAIDKPLMSMNLPAATRIASIERNAMVFIPDSKTRIMAGDIVTLLGDVQNFEKAATEFDPDVSRRKHVVILGQTSMGVWLCRALRGRGFSIRLVVDDQDRAEELAGKLDWVTVLCADVSDTELFEEERLDQADAFIALTHEDERNILAAARAKSLGVGEAIAVLQRSTYLHLIEHVGIDRAFSPRITAVGQIQQFLDRSPFKHVASLAPGIAEVYEIRIPYSGAEDVVNVPLKSLSLPPRTLIAAVQHGDETHVPGAMTQLKPGDTVVMIGPEASEKPLLKMFGIR
jgi:trk system potassium uptake protein TrkA